MPGFSHGCLESQPQILMFAQQTSEPSEVSYLPAPNFLPSFFLFFPLGIPACSVRTLKVGKWVVWFGCKMAPTCWCLERSVPAW